MPWPRMHFANASRLLRWVACSSGVRWNCSAKSGRLASQAVCDLFQEEESAALAMLSDFIGKPVSIQVETGYAQEQYDIVLL